MYIYIYIYTYIHNIYTKCMRTAKYLFEFEKIYIFMYTVSFCTISVVAQIGIGTISIVNIVTQIPRPTFLRQGFSKDLQGCEFYF